MSKKETRAALKDSVNSFFSLETDCGPGEVPCSEDAVRSWYRIYVGMPDHENRFVEMIRSRGGISEIRDGESVMSDV
jgi:hypothetical protein